MIRNPASSRTKNKRASQLKYLSINPLMPGPYFLNRDATAKNRSERLIVDAIINKMKFILKTPEAMVKIL